MAYSLMIFYSFNILNIILKHFSLLTQLLILYLGFIIKFFIPYNLSSFNLLSGKEFIFF